MNSFIPRLLVLIFSTGVLAACSYAPIYTEPDQPGTTGDQQRADYPSVEDISTDAEEPVSAPSRVAIATPESVDQSRNKAPQSRTASDKLRDQARIASDAGEYSNAERLLDRALRIAPREAATYYQLALLKLRQGAPGQALQLARKGLSLGPEYELQERLRAIEQDAETRAGGG